MANAAEENVLTSTIPDLSNELRTILDKVRLKTESPFGTTTWTPSYGQISTLINNLHNEITALF